MMRGALSVCLIVLAGPVLSADLIATLSSNNGTVPPMYHRHQTVRIVTDGAVTLRACRGYGDTDAACITATGRTTPEAVAAIVAAARAAGLPEQPVTPDPEPPIGGGMTFGTVFVDGAAADLPAFPIEADRGRTQAVVDAIRAAIPADTLAAIRPVMEE